MGVILILIGRFVSVIFKPVRRTHLFPVNGGVINNVLFVGAKMFEAPLSRIYTTPGYNSRKNYYGNLNVISWSGFRCETSKKKSRNTDDRSKLRKISRRNISRK